MTSGRVLYEVHVSKFDMQNLGIGVTIIPLPKTECSPGRTHAVGYVTPGRKHLLEGVLARETPDGFIWDWKPDRDKPASIITFKVCTLERFKERWRGIEQDVPDIRYEEDLHEWYRRRLL